MGRIWEYVYWRLPLGKKQFFEKIGDLKQSVETIINYRNEFHGRLDALTFEINRLHEENARLERIITHYHKQDMTMFWEGYRKKEESTEDAQKRFFHSLPEAKGVNRNLQLLEKELLKAFIEICEKNGLQYWIYAGTLLGAVRHKGFIPWDDDVDTCMPRDEIGRLRNILEDNEIYELTVRYDPVGLCKQIRFCYKKSKLPVFVDVFPCDWACEATRESWEANYKVKQELIKEITDETNPLIKKFREMGCVDDNSVIGEKIARIFDKYFEKLHTENILCNRENAEGLLFSFDSCNSCDDSNINAVTHFFPLQTLEFEGINCRVPNQYMYILRELYGEDLYTFPCGEPHFVHADWKKNAKLLEAEVKKRIE